MLLPSLVFLLKLVESSWMGGIMKLAREALRLWVGEMLGLMLDRGLPPAALGLGVALSRTRSRRSTADGGAVVVGVVVGDSAGETDRVGSIMEVGCSCCDGEGDGDGDGVTVDEYGAAGAGEFVEKEDVAAGGSGVCVVGLVCRCVEEEEAGMDARCSKAEDVWLGHDCRLSFLCSAFVGFPWAWCSVGEGPAGYVVDDLLFTWL